MVRIAFSDDVRNSFSKVKEDMLALKRSLNKELLAIEEITAKLQSNIQKDEFYSFVKKLGNKLDGIEAAIETYAGHEEELKETDRRIKLLSNKLAKREDLSSELRETRVIKARLNAFEELAVKKQEFHKELSAISAAIASLRTASSPRKSTDEIRTSLTELRTKTEELAAASATKNEQAAKISELRKAVEAAERKAASKEDVEQIATAIKGIGRAEEESRQKSEKNVKDAVTGISSRLEILKEQLADKKHTENSIRELKKETYSLRELLDKSVSEVDLSEYATKKEVDRKLQRTEDTGKETTQLRKELATANRRIDSLGNEFAQQNDVKRIGTELKELNNTIHELKKGIDKIKDAAERTLRQETEKTRNEFGRELSKLRADFEDKIEENKRSRQGIIQNLGKGISEFFKEEEETESILAKEKKQQAKTSEAAPKKSAEKGRKTHLGLISTILAFSIFAAAMIFYFSQNMADKTAETTNETAKISENAMQNLSAESRQQKMPESLLEQCKKSFECKEKGKGEYWYDCNIDEKGTCRCYSTIDATICGIDEKTKAAKEPEKNESMKEKAGKQKLKGAAVYIGTVIIFIAVAVLAYKLMSGKPKQDKHPEEKQKTKETKEKGDEEGSEDSVDLEEFFEKK
ncbi:hypothetical protein HYU12_02100 [Candidatus Woesearchaeota archaeon]|nr:hypothetical protein [Candidatus Woesearchaeota archaeon]